MRTILTFLRRLLLRRPHKRAPRQPWLSPNSLHHQPTPDGSPTPEGNELLDACRSLAPIILEACSEIEQARRIPASLLQILKEKGFFRMTMPKSWGGYELDPVTQLRVIEELSSLDASVGWCVMIGSDGGYFTGYLEQSVAREMYQDIDAITGSGIFPSGKAHWTPGGYKVSGRWRFGSGCQHADWMAAGCVEYKLGIPCIGLDGIPKTRVCMVPANTIKVHDTWTTTGLRGSGSHDWVLEDTFVPAERTFDILRPKCYRTEALYQLPGMFMLNFPGVALGLARHAIQTFVEIAKNKSLPTKFNSKLADEARIQSVLGKAVTRLAAARAFYLQSLADIWQSLQNSKPAQSDSEPFHPGTAYARLSLDQRILVRLAMMEVHEGCIDVVTDLYKAAGGASVYSTCVLDRLLRDAHTVNQHIVVATRVYETAGKRTFGFPPDEPFF